MDRDPPGAARRGQPQQGEHLRLVAVHAAGRQQAEHVQGAVGAHGVDGGVQRRVEVEAAVLERRLDPGQVLPDHAAGPQVHVADLGVAHLSLGQADRAAMGGDQGVRTGRAQAVPVRRVGGGDGVVGRIVAMAEAVEDQQQQGLGVFHGQAAGRQGGRKSW